MNRKPIASHSTESTDPFIEHSGGYSGTHSGVSSTTTPSPLLHFFFLELHSLFQSCFSLELVSTSISPDHDRDLSSKSSVAC